MTPDLITPQTRINLATLCEDLADLAVDHSRLAEAAERDNRRDDAFDNLGQAKAYSASAQRLIAVLRGTGG